MSTKTEELFSIPVGPVSGTTPYGYYDDDASFQSDAPRFCNLSARKLGYPVIDIELPSGSMFAAFEEGTTEYSYYINNNNVQNNFLDLKGKPTSENVSGKNVSSNFLTFIIRLSEQYGNETDSGGSIEYHKGVIYTTASIQDYDLKTLFEDTELAGKEMEVRKIYHSRIPAANRYYDPSVTTRAFSESFPVNAFNNYSYTMFPIYDDLLKMQHIEFNDTVRKSAYSFRLINNTLRLFPAPTQTLPIYFEYILKEDKTNAGGIISGSESTVSDISNVPYDNLIYTNINSLGKKWIFNYGHAIVQEMLGRVRSKYQSIPSPNGDISLDGHELISKGQEEQSLLKEQLKKSLEKMNTTALLTEKSEQSIIINEELSNIPMGIWVR